MYPDPDVCGSMVIQVDEDDRYLEEDAGETDERSDDEEDDESDQEDD